MIARPSLRPIALVFALGLLTRGAQSDPPRETRSLDDYKHFRIASIDLLGRMPTRDEVTAFEQPSFDFDRWIDAHLTGPAYAERLTRVYMDLLRLEPNLNFSTGPAELFRQEVLDSNGKRLYVYFRSGQRRLREATDGEFCLTPDESGLTVRANAQTVGTPKRVSAKLLDQATTLVRPWWLYRDYRTPHPQERFGEGWAHPDPEYRPVESLLTEPDGKPTLEVRVCREEAERREEGHIYASGRKPPGSAVVSTASAPPKPAPPTLPGGRTRPPPVDAAYAKTHKGEAVSCDTKAALSMAADCGCGVGLERCVPNDNVVQGNAFYFPNHWPLGSNLPLDSVKQQSQRWFPYWWSREAVHFLDYLFAEDRDFREILTGKETQINGPLAQFYRAIQRGNCCGPEAGFGMLEEREPLFDPKRVPTDLSPQDLSDWRLVNDRGSHASGLLTMPMFLEKYASARARGAVLYNAFLCKSFAAGNGPLTPSEEPNLMKRPGCQSCHETLEPLAAYFARIEPGSFVFLPESLFPAKNAKCKKDKNGHLSGLCNPLYDVAFTDDQGAILRSAYGSLDHTNATPIGAAHDITASPEFAACATQRVASSLLGRPTSPDDATLLDSLTHDFVASGYRMRALVRGVLRTPEYRRVNNTASPGATE
jgi:Protein of unknown function (DUF1549)/Protein of unknown function (DUF1585)